MNHEKTKKEKHVIRKFRVLRLSCFRDCFLHFSSSFDSDQWVPPGQSTGHPLRSPSTPLGSAQGDPLTTSLRSAPYPERRPTAGCRGPSRGVDLFSPSSFAAFFWACSTSSSLQPSDGCQPISRTQAGPLFLPVRSHPLSLLSKFPPSFFTLTSPSGQEGKDR